MDTLKTIWGWIKTHMKLVILFVVVLLLTILVFWWGRKNSKIKGLENQLALMTARLKIESLVVSYNTTMEKLAELKAKDAAVKTQLDNIQASLGDKLKPDMTADEIIAKFKEIGLPQ